MKKLLISTTALVVLAGAASAQDKVLNVLDWGGAYGESHKVAYNAPFEEKTGIKITVTDADNPATPIKAMVEAGNVTADVASVEYADAVRLCDEGALEQIDPAILAALGVEKDERAKALEEAEIERLRKDQEDEIRIIRKSAFNRVRELIVGKQAANRVADERKDIQWLASGDSITEDIIREIPDRRWREIIEEAPPPACAARATRARHPATSCSPCGSRPTPTSPAMATTSA